ncbi:hypothetical protein ACHAQA_008388 [Verticillium albo-atrum]
MPCCLTFLSYAGCGHKQLWKTHCTNNCNTVICASSEQEVMASLRYRWRCEECHIRQWDIKERQRAERAEDDERVIIARDDLPEDQKDLFLDNYRVREDWIDRRVEKTRTEQVEEIQWVAEFAEEYGMTMWKLKYSPEDKLPQVGARLEYLLGVKFWDVTIVKDITREDGVASRSRASSATLVDESTATAPERGPMAKQQLSLTERLAEVQHAASGILKGNIAHHEEHQAAPSA